MSRGLWVSREIHSPASYPISPDGRGEAITVSRGVILAGWLLPSGGFLTLQMSPRIPRQHLLQRALQNLPSVQSYHCCDTEGSGSNDYAKCWLVLVKRKRSVTQDFSGL